MAAIPHTSSSRRQGGAAALFILAAAALRFTPASATPSSPPNNPFARFVFPNQAGLAKWSAAKFGLFMHWGAVSEWGTEISFPLVCYGFPCDTVGPNNTALTLNSTEELAAHRAAYAATAKVFNPTSFDPQSMALLAYNAGFRYMTWVAMHCDGFANYNSTLAANYSVVSAPYGRDTLAMAKEAFAARGIRVGVYVCPSFWNNDAYWAPSSSTAFGGCCQPNYTPATNATTAAQWGAFTANLHGVLTELAEQYSPTHFWVDSGTYPPSIDTHLEAVVPAIRSANPEAVIQIRDGGVFRDYIETDDHSELQAAELMGVSYLSPTPGWEVPATFGEQWAYDPRATYKDAPTVIQTLISVIVKGGNYLINLGPGPDGLWAPAAVETLTNMAFWMDFNAESIHGTVVAYPYSYYAGPLDTDAGMPFLQQFTASSTLNSTYVYLVAKAGAVITPATPVVIPPFKPSTLLAPPAAVSYLSPSGALQPVTYTLDEAGLSFPAADILQPAPVLLGTYFFNYTSPSTGLHKRGDAPFDPVPWYKKRADDGARGGTGSVGAARVDPRTGRPMSAPGGGRSQTMATGGSRFADRVAAIHAAASGGRQLDGAALGGSALVDFAPCGLRGCSVYTGAGYTLVRSEGVCYATSFLPGGEVGVPLRLFYNGANDNMGAQDGGAPADGQAWQDVDAECYVYSSAGAPGAGRVPLQVWHSAALQEYWTLADPASAAQAQSLGYVQVGPGPVGWVDPAPAGGFTPEQQKAQSASYAYVLRVDW